MNIETVPLVSVIVPCYNYSRFLPETLESVLAQTCNDWECIIVDDGSTDNTANVAKLFMNKDNRFVYVYQCNSGLSTARNKGIGIAKGKYLQFLDADDLIEKEKLKTQIAVMENNYSIDIIYSDVRYFIDGSPNKKSCSYDMMNIEWMPKISGKGHEILKALIFRNIMPVNAPIIRSKVFEIVGCFDEELNAFEDWYYWLKCGLANQTFHYDGRASVYAIVRLHSDSMTKDNNRLYFAEILMRRKLHKLFSFYCSGRLLKQYKQENMQYYYTKLGQKGFKDVYEGSLIKGLLKMFLISLNTGKLTFYFKNTMYWLQRRVLDYLK